MIMREKKFYKTFISLNVMMAAQNILAYGVNLADNIMLGRYSETALAASSLVNQIQYLLQMVIVAGLGAGSMVLVSQYWGKKEPEHIRRLVALAMKFAAGIGLIFFCVTYFFPALPLGLLTNQESIHAEGLSYVRIMAFTYLLFPLYSTLVTCLRGIRITHIGPITSAVSLLINILLNHMLIFGNWGVPELGIRGAAIATLISRVLELLIVIIYVRFYDQKLSIRLLSFFKPGARNIRMYLRTVSPVVASGALWGVGMMMQTAILGRMGETVIAASSIAMTIFQIFTVYSHGAANTAGVMVGNIVGAGKTEDIVPCTRSLQLLFIINGIATSLALFFSRDLILSYYMLSPETLELAHSFVSELCLVVIFSSYVYPVQNGIIMGGGSTRYALIVDMLFLWMAALPLAAMSAFVWKLPPLITFMFLKADHFLKCIPNVIVVNHYRWIRDLTRKASGLSE